MAKIKLLSATAVAGVGVYAGLSVAVGDLNFLSLSQSLLGVLAALGSAAGVFLKM